MPKTSRRPPTRPKKAGGRKRTPRARTIPGRMPALRDDEAGIDGCDLEFSESDVTPDTELPASTGGVGTVRGTHRRAAVRR